MQIGIIGLGRMGSNVALRLLKAGHRCVVFDEREKAVEAMAREGATGFSSASELVASLQAPRVVWLMVPPDAVDATLSEVETELGSDDTVIDAGDSHYQDDVRRSHSLAASGVHYFDVGISGRNGSESGYCLMIGGDVEPVRRLLPLFDSLAPHRALHASVLGVAHEPAPSTRERHEDRTPLERGYLHCGPSGAGHFVKMVHDGIERNLMEAYATGFNILRRADGGARSKGEDERRYEFDVPAIAEVWRSGSVVESFLLDLASVALAGDPSRSGWGRRAAELGMSRRAQTMSESLDGAPRSSPGVVAKPDI